MSVSRLWAVALAASLVALVPVALAVAGPAPSGPYRTGVVATEEFFGAGNGADGAGTAFARASTSGARFLRIFVYWSEIAPSRPAAGTDPRDPGNPAYKWEKVDTIIRQTHAGGLIPIVDILGAPEWAWQKKTGGGIGQGPIRPSVAQLANITAAAVKRYDGRTPGLPRVRYWQLWNEPNLSTFLRPQFENDKLVSPGWYRKMVNAFYDAVHSTAAGNVVIAGGTSPFTVQNESYVGPGPLRFMRDLLCMSADPEPRPTCKSATKFDVWAHHPYTSGGPTHAASNPDDASLGDLPRMKALLDAAVAARHVRSAGTVQFWVTEFSWDSAPPDPKGVPMALHARWVAEALYRAWQSGVSVFTWLRIRDDPFVGYTYCQCGLYLRGETIEQDTPKPALQAFRFPFVAFSQAAAAVSFWGRTPASNARTLVIEQKAGERWKTMATVRSDRFGIFRGTYASTAKTGFVRARILGSRVGESAVPFGLRVPPDRTLCPFGTC